MDEQGAVAAADVAADVGGFPATIRLSRPIRVDGEEVSALTLREPTLAALEGVHITVGEQGANINLGDLPKLIGKMADIPPSSAREISLLDLGTIGGLVFGFLGLSQPIGGS